MIDIMIHSDPAESIERQLAEANARIAALCNERDALLASAANAEKSARMIGELRLMNDADRQEFLDLFRADFCIHCGSDAPACYCTRDD